MGLGPAARATERDSFDVVRPLAGVGDGVRLLDLACGSGLALQRAQARGAVCSWGIDAADGLLAVAGERAPAASLTHGDTADLPYDDTFDVVTCVDGVQYGSG